MATNTQNTAVRERVAKSNEDQVIAENALEMERMVAWVRLATMLLLALSNLFSIKLFGGYKPVKDPLRAAVMGTYLFLSVACLVVVYRVKPSMHKAYKAEMVLSFLDFGVMTFMGIRAFQLEHQLGVGQGAAIYMLLLCFSIGRVSIMHVFAAWALACTGYTYVMFFTDNWQPQTALFVISCFTALALLVGMMQRRIRHMFLNLRKRDNLTRFLPPQVAEEVMKLGDAPLQPVQREVTVLFSDIRDFTSFSESLPPGAVLQFLDEYFGHMSHLVKAHDGIVNKFLGDGMLAFWGVPQKNPRHAELAVKAALDMRKVVEELNQVRRNNGAQPIRIGIGIHTGQVAAGMLGGADQHEYTVIGDAVNVASRVEGLTKQLGVDILVSESTWAQLGNRYSGHKSLQNVKGRQEGVVVYALGERLANSDAAA
jgi:adenylate cyclase